MFVLGHLGIGARLGSLVPGVDTPRTARFLLLGTLLPDLIDKPLYYGLVLATGRHAAELGLFSSTRTVGHTVLLGLCLWLFFGALGRGPEGRALFAGLATHWLLDLGGELAGGVLGPLGLGGSPVPATGPSTLAAILFPLLGPHFPIMPYSSATEHLLSLRSTYTIGGELVGGALLYLRYRARRAGGTKTTTNPLTKGPPPPGAPGR